MNENREENNMHRNDSMPCVSIIVPVYNVSLYLEQCIESLIHQSYKNLQIVLVDDGSKDSSYDICKNYAKKDKRISIVHKLNEGASLARRDGIKYATGQYIMMVDGDDWIDLNTCEECVNVALRDDADCVMFAYIRERERKRIPNYLFEKDFTYSKEEAEDKIHRRLIGMRGSELSHPEKIDNLSSMCMKMYRTENARKGKSISEKIVGTSEDTVFNIYALEDSRISYINKCFYHYRRTNAESITTKHKDDLSEKWDVLYQILENYLEERGLKEKYYPFFLNRVACGMIGLGLNEVSGKGNIVFKIKHIKKILEKPLYKKAFSQLNTNYCPLKWKMFFELCKKKFVVLLTILLMIINCLRV